MLSTGECCNVPRKRHTDNFSASGYKLKPSLARFYEVGFRDQGFELSKLWSVFADSPRIPAPESRTLNFLGVRRGFGNIL